MGFAFRTLLDEEGSWFVREDGSAGSVQRDDTVYTTLYRSLIPTDVTWYDWPSDRTDLDEPAIMRVRGMDDASRARREIARRWGEMMLSFVKNGR
jgi:hypothetical protein